MDKPIEKRCPVCLNYFWEPKSWPKVICPPCNGVLDKIDLVKFKRETT